MLTIDGSQHSGSGRIGRYSVARRYCCTTRSGSSMFVRIAHNVVLAHNTWQASVVDEFQQSKR